MEFLFVGVGGAVGAMLRYGISLTPYKGTFPILTLITNIIGAVLIGAIVGVAVKKNWSSNTVLFLKTGVCGGFTTFSTFSLEAHNLFQAGRTTMAVTYMILSVVCCVSGVMVGMLAAEKC